MPPESVLSKNRSLPREVRLEIAVKAVREKLAALLSALPQEFGVHERGILPWGSFVVYRDGLSLNLQYNTEFDDDWLLASLVQHFAATHPAVGRTMGHLVLFVEGELVRQP